MCPIFNGCEVGAYRSDFCLWGWMKSEVCKEKVSTRGELVARVMNSAVVIRQERQEDFRRATRTVAKRVEKCTEVDGGIFEHLFWIVAIYWDHLPNKYMQSIRNLSFLHTFCRVFMRNIKTAVSPHQLKFGHIFIWTSLLGMVHSTTPFNIYYSSWNTLYSIYIYLIYLLYIFIKYMY